MENPLLRQGNEVPGVMKAEVHSVDIAKEYCPEHRLMSPFIFLLDHGTL